VGGNAGRGAELSGGPVPGSVEAEGCAGRDWGAGRVSGTGMMGTTLGRAWGSAWTAAPGCSRRFTDPAEVVPRAIPPGTWPVVVVAHAVASKPAAARRMDAFRITCP